jgi:orotate phosphoribosyltransferase
VSGPAAIDRLLEQSGALRTGHFSLSSGLHSASYVQCALLLELPERARSVGQALASRLADFGATTIVAPALGGVIIGHEVAAALGVSFRFTERSGGAMCLRRGFTLEPEDRVVIVEDVVTTGRSSTETISVVEELGAKAVAVGAIVDRRDGDFDLGRPLRALKRLEFATYEPSLCPLCRQGEPLTRPGSRTVDGPESGRQPSASR